MKRLARKRVTGWHTHLWPVARMFALRTFFSISDVPSPGQSFCVDPTGPDRALVAGIIASYCGFLEERERVLKPFRAFGPPLADQIRPRPPTSALSCAPSPMEPSPLTSQ